MDYTLNEEQKSMMQSISKNIKGVHSHLYSSNSIQYLSIVVPMEKSLSSKINPKIGLL